WCSAPKARLRCRKTPRSFSISNAPTSRTSPSRRKIPMAAVGCVRSPLARRADRRALEACSLGTFRRVSSLRAMFEVQTTFERVVLARLDYSAGNFARRRLHFGFDRLKRQQGNVRARLNIAVDQRARQSHGRKHRHVRTCVALGEKTPSRRDLLTVCIEPRAIDCHGTAIGG